MSQLRGFDVYPSGFARVNPEQSGTGAAEPDSMACEHFTKMLHSGFSTVEFRNFDSVVRNALALLGAGPDWILVQSMNPNLDKYKVEFIVDTVNYIATGKRRMLLATWRQLCAGDNDGLVKPIVMDQRVVNPQITVPREWLKGHPTEVISQWIAKDGGLVDLIETMYLMFGGVTGSGAESR